MLSIRRANKEDIELIRSLTMQVWPATYNPIIGEQQVAYMLQQFYAPNALAAQMDNGHTFIIGYWNSEPVAFASYGVISEQHYKLHKLYILPAMQGNGIGRGMLNHITADIAGKASGLRLNVNRYNLPAKAFYERVGFSVVHDEDIDIGNGFYMNDHVLELALI